MSSASVTISLPKELIEFVDSLAENRSTSRSGVIAAVLLDHIRRHREEEMLLAYQDWAEENEAIAEEMRPLAMQQLSKVEYRADAR